MRSFVVMCFNVATKSQKSPERMMMMHPLHHNSKVVGTKQTLKALQQRRVIELYIAKDANPEQLKTIIHLAKKQQLPIVEIPTMDELGIACEVEVKTATAALIVNNDGHQSMMAEQ
jgi:large subunit ribosomal protein L7A